MSTLVLDQAQVEQLLTMPECIELMEETLVALARDELYQPLRSVVRPPGADGFMGLMPAHRGGETPPLGSRSSASSPATRPAGSTPIRARSSYSTERPARSERS